MAEETCSRSTCWSLRPSQDLGRLANNFEAELPRGFRFLLRGLGSRETRSNDLLSLLMFQRDYISRLIDLGEADARARGSEIAAFLQPAVRRERPRPVLVAKPPETPSRFGQSRRNWYHDTSRGAGPRRLTRVPAPCFRPGRPEGRPLRTAWSRLYEPGRADLKVGLYEHKDGRPT